MENLQRSENLKIYVQAVRDREIDKTSLEFARFL